MEDVRASPGRPLNPAYRGGAENLDIDLAGSTRGFGLPQAAEGPEREPNREQQSRSEGCSDLGRGAGEEAAARLEHTRQRIHDRNAMDPALEQRQRHVDGGEEEHQEDREL